MPVAITMRCRFIPPLAVLSCLVGCGTAAGPAASCTVRQAAPPHVARGAFAAFANAASLTPGATASFTVTVTGPATFSASCGGPLQLFVADSTALRVFTASASPGPASPCGAVSLPPGKRDVYAVTWPVDPTLPYGTYIATLVLGDQSPLQLTVVLVAGAGAC